MKLLGELIIELTFSVTDLYSYALSRTKATQVATKLYSNNTLIGHIQYEVKRVNLGHTTIHRW